MGVDVFFFSDVHVSTSITGIILVSHEEIKGQERTHIKPEPSAERCPQSLRCKKVSFQLEHRQNLSSAVLGKERKKKQKPGKRVAIREKINIPK